MATVPISRYGGGWQAPHTPQLNRSGSLADGLFFHAALSEQGENAAHDAVSTLHQSSGIIHPGLGQAGYGRNRSDATSNLEFGFFERQKIGTGPFTLAVYGRLDSTATALNALSNGGGANQFRILTNYNGSGGAAGYLNCFTYGGATISDLSVANVIEPERNCWYFAVRRADGVLQIWRDHLLMGESTALTLQDVSGSNVNPMQVGFTTANSTGRAITRASAWSRALVGPEMAALATDPDLLTSRRRIWVPVTSSVGITAVAVDTLTASDAAVSARTAPAGAADTLTTSDAAVSARTAPADASDTVGLVDSAIAAVGSLAADGVDTLSVSDSSVSSRSAGAAAADTLVVSDSAVGARTAVATAADSVSLGDLADGAVAGGTVVVATDALSLSDGAAAILAPQAAGGGRAWMRTWLQQQYEADFARYAAEREAKLAPKSAPPAAAPVAARRVAPVESAAPRATAEKKPVLPALRIERVEPTAIRLPPETDLSAVRRAAAKSAERIQLMPNEEEALLKLAAQLNL